MNVFGGKLESACLSVHVFLVRLRIHISFCIQNTGNSQTPPTVLIQFYKTLHLHWSYIEVLQDLILKCQLLLVEELSPFELRILLEIVCLCQSAGGGINPLLHRYSFWCINNRQLLKTLWEKEKFVYIFDIISLFEAEFEDPKIGISGKGLSHIQWRL